MLPTMNLTEGLTLSKPVQGRPSAPAPRECQWFHLPPKFISQNALPAIIFLSNQRTNGFSKISWMNMETSLRTKLRFSGERIIVRNLVIDFEESFAPVARLKQSDSSFASPQAATIDISYQIMILQRAWSNPTLSHRKAGKQILSTGTNDMVVMTPRGVLSGSQLKFLVLDSLVRNGHPKKQKSNKYCHSTTEAEYMPYQDAELKSSGKRSQQTETMDLRSTKFRCIVDYQSAIAQC
ncbi:hypothetical protein Tco_1429348 [Tanacetum coccineum]